MRFLLLMALLLGCSRQQPMEPPWILEVAPANAESSLIPDSRGFGVIWAKLRDEGGSMVHQGHYFALVRQHEDRAKGFVALYSPFTRWAAEMDIARFRVWRSTEVPVGRHVTGVFLNEGGNVIHRRTGIHGLMEALAATNVPPDPVEEPDWGINFVW